MLFVGFVLLAVGIQAECFRKQPLRVLGVWLCRFVVRLVAEADECRPVAPPCTESELFLLCRVYVERRNRHVAYAETVAVLHFMQHHHAADECRKLCGQCLPAYPFEHAEHLVVPIHMQHAVVNAIS